MTRAKDIVGTTPVTPEVDQHEVIYVEDTQEATAILWSQLRPSSVQPRSSAPAKRKHVEIEDVVPRTPDREVITESSVPDTESSRMKTPVFNSRKRHRSSSESDIPRYRLRRVEHDQRRTYQIQQRFEALAADATRHHEQTAESGHLPTQSDSQLPTSYSLSERTSSRSKASSMQRSASDPGPTHSSSVERQPIFPINQRQAVAPPIVEDVPREERPLPLSEQQSLGSSTQTESHGSADSHGKTRILHHPCSSVSDESFKSHITERLAFLAGTKQMTDVFKPAYTSRDIDTHERGYWTFTMSSWTTALRESFWEFMTQFIERGGAGWGVTCVHGAEAPHTTDPNTIKTFCWGEIVQHVYLLLYTASNSKVRKLGLRWIDSAGEIVIQMPQPTTQ